MDKTVSGQGQRPKERRPEPVCQSACAKYETGEQGLKEDVYGLPNPGLLAELIVGRNVAQFSERPVRLSLCPSRDNRYIMAVR